MRCLLGGGEAVAKLILHALPQLRATVTEQELYEVMSDYLAKSSARSYYSREFHDGLAESSCESDLKALWRLVPEVPEAASYVLIEHLPPGVGPKGSLHFNDCLPLEVLGRLNDPQLEALFERSDIAASDLRKSKFFAAEEKDFMLRGAAASHNLNLTHEEFSQVLARPPKHRAALLNDLASADDLELCFYEAIDEALANLDDYDFLDSGPTGEQLEKRLRELRGHARKTQVRELRLYRLAGLIAPGHDGYQLPDQLCFLGEHVVKGDVWATFMAVARAWHSRPGTERLEEYLPLVEEVGCTEM
jgi:hypothetical protein